MANHNATAPSLKEAIHEEGVPHSGTKALTVDHAEAGAHADPTLFGVMDATVWVSLAMAVFLIILLVKKVPGLIGRMLDQRISDIRDRLEAAKILRAEAEQLRDEYVRKLADAENQTKAIVSHAEQEAAALVAKAKADSDELVVRRTKMAEDKIAAAERAAIAEVRARTAAAASKAAATLIGEKMTAAGDKALVDRTIAGLGRPN